MAFRIPLKMILGSRKRRSSIEVPPFLAAEINTFLTLSNERLAVIQGLSHELQRSVQEMNTTQSMSVFLLIVVAFIVTVSTLASGLSLGIVAAAGVVQLSAILITKAKTAISRIPRKRTNRKYRRARRRAKAALEGNVITMPRKIQAIASNLMREMKPLLVSLEGIQDKTEDLPFSYSAVVAMTLKSLTSKLRLGDLRRLWQLVLANKEGRKLLAVSNQCQAIVKSLDEIRRCLHRVPFVIRCAVYDQQFKMSFEQHQKMARMARKITKGVQNLQGQLQCL